MNPVQKESYKEGIKALAIQAGNQIRMARGDRDHLAIKRGAKIPSMDASRLRQYEAGKTLCSLTRLEAILASCGRQVPDSLRQAYLDFAAKHPTAHFLVENRHRGRKARLRSAFLALVEAGQPLAEINMEKLREYLTRQGQECDVPMSTFYAVKKELMNREAASERLPRQPREPRRTDPGANGTHKNKASSDRPGAAAEPIITAEMYLACVQGIQLALSTLGKTNTLKLVETLKP